MKDSYSAPFHSYWRNRHEDVLEVLRVLKNQSPLADIGNSSQEDIFAYAGQIFDVMQVPDTPERIQAREAIVSLLSAENGTDMSQVAEDDPATIEVLHERIELIAAALGLVTRVERLAPEEVGELLKKGSPSKEEHVRLNYTLHLVLLGNEEGAYADYILPYLFVDGIAQERQFFWYEALLQHMFLRTVWAAFRKIDEEDQFALCTQYIYRSIVCGVPVRSVMYNILYESVDAIDLVFWYEFFGSAFEKNREEIPTSTQDETYAPFQRVMADFLSHVGENLLDGLRQQELIRRVYENQRGRDKYIAWLQEMLYILTHMKRGMLCETPRYEEKTKTLRMFDELDDLLAAVLDKQTWPDISVYLKKEDTLVDKQLFLYELREGFDLEKQPAVEHLSALSQFLRQEEILEESDELLTYDESTGSFEWNNDTILDLE